MITAWILVAFVFSPSASRLEAVEMGTFKTHAECSAQAGKEIAKRAGKNETLGCIQKTERK